MATDWAETLKEVQKASALLKQSNPGMMDAFQVMRTANHNTDAIDAKTRELIAVAVAVTVNCHGCIASHVFQAKRAGATREEIGAAVGTAIAIGAGSAYVHSLEALAAYEEL